MRMEAISVELPAKCRRQIAFTLVELVVCGFIVTLTVAIAAPALSEVQRDGAFAKCQFNLKKIATASRAYSGDDRNSFLIPVHANWTTTGVKDLGFGAYEFGGKSGVGTRTVPTEPADPLDSPYGSLAGVGPATRPLNPYVTGRQFQPVLGDAIRARADAAIEIEEFRCPNDDGPPGAGHCPDWVRNRERSSYDHFGTSYAANIFPTANQGGGPASSNSPFLRPSSRVPNPARTLLYEENIGRWAWAARREIGGDCLFIGRGVPVGSTKSLGAWHGEDWNYNRAFVDGSARYQSIYIEGTEDQEGYALHYRSEIVYPDDPSLQQNLQCIIVRGDGWQKDTLPAARVLTGQQYGGSGRPSYGDCVEPADGQTTAGIAGAGALK